MKVLNEFTKKSIRTSHRGGAPMFPQPVATGRFSEGHAWRRSDLDAWIKAGGLLWNMLGKSTGGQRNEGDYFMSDVVNAYKEANDLIENVQEAYGKIVSAFKGEIKNDITAISAAAARVQKENVKMRDAYEAAAKLLTSPEMNLAIENAERLATALQVISELKSHSITFAVLDKKTT